jgi:anhydro-N-acetylmuramic acid kinase
MQNLINIYKKPTRICAGLMSGTSVDGIDAAIAEITASGGGVQIKQLAYIERPFPAGYKELVLKNSLRDTSNVEDICRLNFLIAYLYADAVKEACASIKLPLNEIDLIGSHGQTIHHLPAKTDMLGYAVGSTLQIGDPSVLAKLTGIITVGDFRPGDIALGGQGAPLVPYFDYKICSSKEKNRALLNIGGISNISAIKKNSGPDELIAFDTGPGNMMIDILMKRFYDKEYDKNGETALSGKINGQLLHAIYDNDDYINSPPPKSTGREHYNDAFIDGILNNFHSLPHQDIIATFADYTAFAVHANYARYIEPLFQLDEIYVSGGGARNKFIMQSLQKYFAGASVKNFEKLGISSDAKEAICFAFLANETINGNTNNLIKATGASRPAILGKICLP